MPNYNAFPELAATILDFWETLALSAVTSSLLIIFFFTLHKGRVYRISFVLLLCTLLTLLYVDVITPATRRPGWDDMIRPIMYSAWAYTCWARASIFLAYFLQLRGQYENTIERVLSLENTAIPWRDVALFAHEMQRWQKWVGWLIAACFASGLIYSNVDRIEALQVATLVSNHQAKQAEEKSQMAIEQIRRRQDSLFMAQVVDERLNVETVLRKLDKTVDNSAVNRSLLERERRDKRRLLESLRTLEKTLNNRLVPVKTIPPRPLQFQLPSTLKPVPAVPSGPKIPARPGKNQTVSDDWNEYPVDSVYARFRDN